MAALVEGWRVPGQAPAHLGRPGLVTSDAVHNKVLGHLACHTGHLQMNDEDILILGQTTYKNITVAGQMTDDDIII